MNAYLYAWMCVRYVCICKTCKKKTIFALLHNGASDRRNHSWSRFSETQSPSTEHHQLSTQHTADSTPQTAQLTFTRVSKVHRVELMLPSVTRLVDGNAAVEQIWRPFWLDFVWVFIGSIFLRQRFVPIHLTDLSSNMGNYAPNKTAVPLYFCRRNFCIWTEWNKNHWHKVACGSDLVSSLSSNLLRYFLGSSV